MFHAERSAHACLRRGRRRFTSKKWHFQCPNKKVQKTDPPPNVAILGPYKTLGQVSEIGKYFLGYFIIFHVFPMLTKGEI